MVQKIVIAPALAAPDRDDRLAEADADSDGALGACRGLEVCVPLFAAYTERAPGVAAARANESALHFARLRNFISYLQLKAKAITNDGDIALKCLSEERQA